MPGGFGRGGESEISGQPVTVAGGRFYAHLFENANVGIQRGLFWNFEFDCEPIEIDGQACKPLAAIDWLTFPKASTPFSVPCRSGHADQPKAEASFYVFEHTPAKRWRLDIRPEGPGWHAEIDLTVDYPGYDNDPVDNLRIRGTAPVDFGGYLVTKSNLADAPASEAEAVAALRAFVAEGGLDVCDEGFRYVIRPDPGGEKRPIAEVRRKVRRADLADSCGCVMGVWGIAR